MTTVEHCEVSGITITRRPSFGTDFTKSLELLLPVWEKLENRVTHISWNNVGRETVNVSIRPDKLLDSLVSEEWYTVSEAAAEVTAKAIISNKKV